MPLLRERGEHHLSMCRPTKHDHYNLAGHKTCHRNFKNAKPLPRNEATRRAKIGEKWKYSCRKNITLYSHYMGSVNRND